MDARIHGLLRNFSAADGDRVDDVAQALRRFYLRVECCPCMGRPCVQCVNDMQLIEAAWLQTEDLPLVQS